MPVATARALLLAHDARVHAAQALAVAAAAIAVVRAPRDPYDAALVRGDAVLAAVHADLLRLAGDEEAPRMLQAPVSFRVTGPASPPAAQRRAPRRRRSTGPWPGSAPPPPWSTAGSSAPRASTGSTSRPPRTASVSRCCTSPRPVRPGCTGCSTPRVTGLAPQLSAAPGRQAGLVVVHKRAVGLVTRRVAASAPASLGAMETSLGQEDVQSFGLESAQALHHALAVLRDVTACELLAVHQATLLAPDRPRGSERLQLVLRKASGSSPTR